MKTSPSVQKNKKNLLIFGIVMLSGILEYGIASQANKKVAAWRTLIRCRPNSGSPGFD